MNQTIEEEIVASFKYTSPNEGANP